MTEQSIARKIAGAWGIAGSSNLVQWALLALLIAMLLAGAGGWWIGDSLQEGQQAKAEVKRADEDNKALAKTVRDAHGVITAQQLAVAASSKRLEEAASRLHQINVETAREREETRRQMALVRDQLEAALAARPDLRDVRVGTGVLDAWNAANRGRASTAAAGSATGVAQPAAALQPGKPAALSGKPARSPER